MNKILFILILIFVCGKAKSQSDFLKEIKGLPARETYNLHTDKKGFLWIAHNLGLSRFDGQSYKHFAHPKGNNLSVFDLMEDDDGTIWCHDLSGQIFYVKEEKMHFFSGYDHTNEVLFPRMVIRKNQLLVSSKYGLFICDTRTLKSEYIYTPGKKESPIGGLSVINNKVLLYGEGNCFQFDLNNPRPYLEKVTIEGYNFTGQNSRLQPEVQNDTAFIVDNPTGILYKIIIENNRPKVAGKIISGEFINTISIVNNSLYINTKKFSYQPYGATNISGYNISDIEQDKEGNTWYSTLEKGLFVNYLHKWQKLEVKGLVNDIVTRIDQNEKYFIYGTGSGKLIVEETIQNGKTFSISLPERFGSVEFLKFISEDEVFVSGSLGLHYVRINNDVPVKNVLPITVKNIKLAGKSYLVATASGLFKLDRIGNDNVFTQTVLQKKIRTRSVSFDSGTGSILAGFKDGLFQLKDSNWIEVKFNNESIYASSLIYFNSKTYIGTNNRGLIICDKKDTINLNTENGLQNNNVLKSRRFKDRLWIICPFGVQVLDLKTDKFSTDFNLPGLDNIQINDVDERGKVIVIATGESLLFTQQSKAEIINPNGHIINVNVNGKDTIATLPSFSYSTNLRFSISLPLFSEPGQLYYKYRLKGSSNNNWSGINEMENGVDFPALSPGEYIFEAIAHHPRFTAEGYSISYPFTILTPWYSTWLFRIALIIAISLVIYGIYNYRLKQLMKVETFRRKISADLHDDIGSTLSSINIYSSLALQDKDNYEYLGAIQSQAREIISKLDDLVWTINPKNDNIDNLVERMRSFAIPLLKAKNIECEFSFENDSSIQNTSTDNRTNLYLAFKEIINNLVKHSKATNCSIRLCLKNKKFVFVVNDDGIGFDTSTLNKFRNGIPNLQNRAKENKGEFLLESSPGLGTTCTFWLKM